MKEKNLYKLAGLAINDYGMIRNNDRIVVGISGGMDSVALLLLLHGRLQRNPIQYELFPVLVDNFNGKNEEHNQRIDKIGIYIQEKTGYQLQVIFVNTAQILVEGKGKKRDICYLCAQKRRNELIKYADAHNCNKIALGHHKDDIIETTLMNMLFKRELSSMLPRLDLFKGKIDIIRPLAYVLKHQIESFIYEREDQVPIFGEICPSKIVRRDLRREQIRNLLKQLSGEVPNLKNNLFMAFRNPKTDYLLDHLFLEKNTMYKAVDLDDKNKKSLSL